jgi:ketosteroid isomerase-like protein
VRASSLVASVELALQLAKRLCVGARLQALLEQLDDSLGEGQAALAGVAVQGQLERVGNPGPRRVTGRHAVAELYRPYGATIVLDRCYDLAVHHDQVTGVVVLEYASQGRVVATGAAYNNRYISVLSIVDRKVAHWRDYLDPLAVFDAVGWPAAAADRD